METEKNNFMESIITKSKNTQITYSRAYEKFINKFNKPIYELSNKQIIDYVNTFESPNTAALSLNVAINVLRLTERDVTPLVIHRETNSKKIFKHLITNNNKLIETLPSAKQLKEYTQDLYDNGDYQKYIINYLLINYYTRNEDLNLTIVDKKIDTNSTDNFLILQLRPARVIYSRNNYKTAKIYGNKTYTIEDKEFYKATKTLLNKNLIDGNLYHNIKMATYGGIGESNYAKIFIDEIRNNGKLNELNEISQRRGTSVNVLLSSYNIQL